MSRSTGTKSQDTPFPDGMIPLLPGADILATGASGANALTRIAAGEFSLRATASGGTYVIMGGVSSMVFRTGVQDDALEFFGSLRAGGSQNLAINSPNTLSTGSIVGPGSLVTINVISTVGFSAGQYIVIDTVASGVQEFQQISSITSATAMVVKVLTNSHTNVFPVGANNFTTPYGASGRPPFTGLSQLTPQTVARPKGILIKQLDVAYIVNTTAITVPLVALYATPYVNGVAPVPVALIPSATNGLATAASATPYVIPVPVPVANQSFVVTPDTAVTVEFDFTNGTGTVDVLGFFLKCSYNYN